jgi:four helix bundle protein
MFDFEKLSVYSKAKIYNSKGSNILRGQHINSAIRNQLRRSSLSIVLNIAEGSGRKTKADKKNFFIISRGSVFECVAIFDILKTEGDLSKEDFDNLYAQSEELSRMLYSLIGSLE